MLLTKVNASVRLVHANATATPLETPRVKLMRKGQSQILCGRRDWPASTVVAMLTTGANVTTTKIIEISPPTAASARYHCCKAMLRMVQ